MDGIILVNKPQGYTSHDVVNKLRKILGTKKVGHCGTLDPMATGLLVVCVNKATKVLQFLTSEKKEYTATLTLGKHTDSYDQEGKVLKEEVVPALSEAKVKEVLDSFIGTYDQMPPIYSAIKVNGKKLYEYAREGKEVEIEPRRVTIEEITFHSFENNEITFSCICSKGTYIRSLCVDIAERLGTIGYMSALNRSHSGIFDLKDSSTLEEIEAGNYKLISLEEALASYDDYYVKDPKGIMSGKRLKSDKDGYVVIKTLDGKVLAMYEQTGEGMLKSVRGLW